MAAADWGDFADAFRADRRGDGPGTPQRIGDGWPGGSSGPWAEASRGGRADRPNPQAPSTLAIIASIVNDAKSRAGVGIDTGGRHHRPHCTPMAATMSLGSLAAGLTASGGPSSDDPAETVKPASGRTAGHGQSSTPTAKRRSPGRQGVGISSNVVGGWRRVTVIETCRQQRRNVFVFVTTAVAARLARQPTLSLLPRV